MPRQPVEPGYVLGVALARCSVVRVGVVERVPREARYEVVGVVIRFPDYLREAAIPIVFALTDPVALLAREPADLVEAISDASTGVALIETVRRAPAQRPVVWIEAMLNGT